MVIIIDRFEMSISLPVRIGAHISDNFLLDTYTPQGYAKNQ